jgi:hypothetical protein
MQREMNRQNGTQMRMADVMAVQPGATTSGTAVADISKLADLKAQGLLTEEEFAAASDDIEMS